MLWFGEEAFSAFRMLHKECLEMIGRWLRIQIWKRILVVVWVVNILCVPDTAKNVPGNDRTLVEDTKLEVDFCCGVGEGHSLRSGYYIKSVWILPDDC